MDVALPTRDQVRLSAQRSPHAGVWLTALPSTAMHTRVPSAHWQALLRWWLGTPLLPTHRAATPCPKCDSPLDVFGDHAVCCTKNDIQRRHMALQDSLEQLLKDSGLMVEREKGFGDGSRAADLLVHRWDCDGPAAIDVTVRCPLAPHHPLRSPKDLPAWRLAREQEKVDCYADGSARAGWSLHPFVLDTWGGLSATARQFMATLLKRAAGGRLGRARREFEQAFWQRLVFPPMAQLGHQLALAYTVPPLSQHSPYA